MAARDPPESLQPHARHHLTSLPYRLLEKLRRCTPRTIPKASRYTLSWLRSQRTRPRNSHVSARDRHDEDISRKSQLKDCSNLILMLPRELRDQIYEYAWQGTHIYYQDDFCLAGAVNARYLDCDELCEQIQTLPAWVTIHPQIQEEALHFFYQAAEFSVGDGNEYTTPFHGSTSHMSSILSIEKARNITVFGITGFYEPNRDTTSTDSFAGSLDNVGDSPYSFTDFVGLFTDSVNITLNDTQRKLIRHVTDNDAVHLLRLSARLQLRSGAMTLIEEEAHLQALQDLQEASYGISHVQMHFQLAWQPSQSTLLGDFRVANYHFVVSCWILAKSILVPPSTYFTPACSVDKESEPDAAGRESAFKDTMDLPHWKDNNANLEQQSQGIMTTAMAYRRSGVGLEDGALSALAPVSSN